MIEEKIVIHYPIKKCRKEKLLKRRHQTRKAESKRKVKNHHLTVQEYSSKKKKWNKLYMLFQKDFLHKKLKIILGKINIKKFGWLWSCMLQVSLFDSSATSQTRLFYGWIDVVNHSSFSLSMFCDGSRFHRHHTSTTELELSSTPFKLSRLVSQWNRIWLCRLPTLLYMLYNRKTLEASYWLWGKSNPSSKHQASRLISVSQGSSLLALMRTEKYIHDSENRKNKISLSLIKQ